MGTPSLTNAWNPSIHCNTLCCKHVFPSFSCETPVLSPNSWTSSTFPVGWGRIIQLQLRTRVGMSTKWCSSRDLWAGRLQDKDPRWTLLPWGDFLPSHCTPLPHAGPLRWTFCHPRVPWSLQPPRSLCSHFCNTLTHRLGAADSRTQLLLFNTPTCHTTS